MKIKKYFIFGCFLFLLVVFSNVTANNNVSLQGIKIYIDPGHGGIDPGAIYKNIKEEAINLEICLKLKEVFESRGCIVYMTRNGDFDLSSPYADLRKRSDLYNRSKLINDSNSDLYLSIHLNASTSSTWNGSQTFYDKINKNNIDLAKYIQDELKKDLNSKRSYKNISNGYMYKRINIPGVLVEVGFISNENERNMLQNSSYQYKIVNAIANGVEKYVYYVHDSK